MESQNQSPYRKTVTTISHDDLTLEFFKDRGEMRLKIDQGAPYGVVLPLWALLEIRDWCAVNLPSMGPPEFTRR